MDGAGNVSTNANTAGRDSVTITLAPIAPPLVSTVLVGNSDTMDGLSSERAIAAGQDLYIRWTASGPNLGSTPVTLFFTTDDTSYFSIGGSALTNGNNNCPSLTGSGAASAGATGCYKWSTGSPSSSYYRVRVAITNSVGASTFANSLPINSTLLQVIAGNTESGLNGDAKSAFFTTASTNGTLIDPGSITLKSDGTIFVRDVSLGLLYVSPVDKIVRRLIPTGATSSGYGDGGPASQAKLRQPVAMAMDYKDRLLIYDFDRIRRIDLSQNPPTIISLIGGGASSALTLADPRALSLAAESIPLGTGVRVPLIPLPNGDILFRANNHSLGYGNGVIRRYLAASNSIVSINPNGGGYTSNGYTFVPEACSNPEFVARFDSLTSEISQLLVHTTQGTSSACTTPASTFKYNGVYSIDPATGAFLGVPAQFNGGSFDSGSGYNSDAMAIQAKNGQIYEILRGLGVMRTYNVTANTWTTLAGTGTVGSCDDGTVATACPMDLIGGFVDSAGNIYLLDRGRVRVIVDGKVQTIAGQSPSFGDTGLPTNARFGLVWNVQKKSTGDFVILDHLSHRLRQFTKNSIINTIAGNDQVGTPNTTSLATTQPMVTSQAYQNVTNFGLDPATDDIYYTFGTSRIGRLSSATNKWSVFAGGGATVFAAAPNGSLATSVSMPNSIQQIYGMSNTGLALGTNYYVDLLNKYYTILEVNLSDGKFYADVGKVNNTNSGAFCADGVSGATCNNMPYPGASSTSDPAGSMMASYDSTNNLWIFIDQNQKSLRSFAYGGNLGTWTTTNNKVVSFLALRIAGTRYVYYCSDTGRMYLRNIDTATEAALSWPIPSMFCKGYNITYDPVAQSVVFPFTQNGLYGVGELFSADPASNGL